MLNKSQSLLMDLEEEKDTIKSLKMYAHRPIHGNLMTIRALLNAQVKRQRWKLNFADADFINLLIIPLRIINDNDHPTTTLRLKLLIGYEYPETPSSLTT